MSNPQPAPRLTKPLLDAMLAALQAALAGEIGEGDFEGMKREPFERAQAWVSAQLERRRPEANP